jgi:hypothetical protein
VDVGDSFTVSASGCSPGGNVIIYVNSTASTVGSSKKTYVADSKGEVSESYKIAASGSKYYSVHDAVHGISNWVEVTAAS